MKEIERTIKLEGGYSNRASDKGGETKYGICKRWFPNEDIKNLTEEHAAELYQKMFWKPMKLDLIQSARVRWKLFDIGVNCGSGTAIRLLQRVVGAKEDGVMGEETANLANAAGENALLFGLMKEQIKRYADIVAHDTSQLVNLQGWINRAFDLGEGL